MSFDYQTVFNECIFVLDSYNNNYSPDFHLQECKKFKKFQNEEFIHDVVVGCCDKYNVINVVLEEYFKKEGKSTLKSEETALRIITYVILYEIQNIELQGLKEFIKCIEINRIYKYLKFLFNEKNLTTAIKDGWVVHYDISYIEINLLNPLLNLMPELHHLLKQLQKLVNNVSSQKPTGYITRPKSFDLSETRPRRVLIPQQVSHTFKRKEVPKSLYENPKEQEELKQISISNKQKSNQLLITSKIQQPKCATIDLKGSIKAKENDNFQKNVQSFEANLAPKNQVNSIPVKLNSAVVLRQGHLYKKESEKVLKKLKELEVGNGDCQEFFAWQEEMRKADLDAELLEIEKRKLEGKISYEEAILAKTRLVEDNKKKAEKAKEEKQALLEKYNNEREEEMQKLKNIINEVNKDHENVKEIKEKVRINKQKTAKEINQESKRLSELAIKQTEEEMNKKMELIQQIKAMESLPIIKSSFIDLTSTAGHSLLSEMSIAELRERLQILRYEELQRIEEKHDEIIQNKVSKNQLLVDTLEFINKYKNGLNKQDNEIKQPQKELNKMSVRDNSEIKGLNDRLSSVKNERKQLKENEKKRNETMESHNKDLHLLYVKQRKMLERNRIKDLECAKERVTKNILNEAN